MFGELSVLRVEVVSGCTLVCTIRLNRRSFLSFRSASDRNA
jgi:hypothetical protein